MANSIVFPTKRMSVAALILNNKDELLIVKPSYRDGWLLPGGIVEKDESPSEACKREVKEELGVIVNLTELVLLDYTEKCNKYEEGFHIIFRCEDFTEENASNLKLKSDELSEYTFVASNLFEIYFNGVILDRLKSIFDSNKKNRVEYMERRRLFFADADV